MNNRSIIIDTDLGHDDIVAILFALGAAELNVLGVTVVAGNLALTHATNNARIVCEQAGRRDVPVFAGCERPLLRKLVAVQHVSDNAALADTAQIADATPPTLHAVDFIINTLMNQPADSITLCMLGPLTNLAMAIVREPRIIPRIAEVVLMGGAYFEGGNVTPSAEFNIYVDPDAAATVLNSGAKITMLPLDVTNKILFSPTLTTALQALPNHASQMAVNVMSTPGPDERPRYGDSGTPLHDPTVIAYVLKSSLFTGRHVHVAVEQTSELTLGATPVDWWGITGKTPNVYYIDSIENDGFYALLAEKLATLP